MSMGSYAIVIDGDLIECSHMYQNDLRDREDSYILFEGDEAAEQAAAEVWRTRAATDPDELVSLVGAEKIVEMWANGTTLEDFISDLSADDEFGSGESSLDVTNMLEYVKGEWPELADWIDEEAGSCDDYDMLEDVVDEDDEDADDKARIVELLQGWQEVIDECGFTPTIAYKR